MSNKEKLSDHSLTTPEVCDRPPPMTAPEPVLQGPWYGDGEPFNGQIAIYHPTEGVVGHALYGTSLDEECRSIALLMAAGPVLLAALQYARNLIGPDEIIDAALSKASPHHKGEGR